MLTEYRDWCQRESDKIKADLMARAKRGASFNAAVYFIPATKTEFAKLTLADERPEGATDVIRFPGVGSRVGAVAYQHLFGGIYDACHNLAVFPYA